MDTEKELREQCTRHYSAMEAIIETAKQENRGLTGKERDDFDFSEQPPRRF